MHKVTKGGAVNTWVFMGLEALPVRVLLVPIEDASDKGRCKCYLRFCTGHSLGKGEQQGHVAVDAMFLLQLPGKPREKHP